MAEREEMLREIRREVQYTRRSIGREALSARVMQAMADVPRDAFVPTSSRRMAYYNGPLPIGEGQTISQPFMVALMTDLLDPEPEDVMLEVGTGSGYQAAVLSRLVDKVCSVEIRAGLSLQAAKTLARLGYDNVECRVGDGYEGWPEQAPFDGIVVTAAAPYIPNALVDQLKPGGRLVIPLGLPYSHQELFVVEKDAEGNMSSKEVLEVAFVPLVHPSEREAGDEAG